MIPSIKQASFCCYQSSWLFLLLFFSMLRCTDMEECISEQFIANVNGIANQTLFFLVRYTLHFVHNEKKKRIKYQIANLNWSMNEITILIFIFERCVFLSFFVLLCEHGFHRYFGMLCECECEVISCKKKSTFQLALDDHINQFSHRPLWVCGPGQCAQ